MRNCDNCDVELIPVDPERMRRRNDYPQYQDALVIDLRGGYGMLIDPLEGITSAQPMRFVLCKDCGTNLVRANKFMQTLETEHILNEESP